MNAKRKDASPPPKTKSEDEERKHQEQDDYLEEALEETFPASDPIAPGHVTDRKN